MRARLAVVLLWVAACQSPEDIFEFRGTVVAADGAPVPGQTVSLARASGHDFGGCAGGLKPISSTTTDGGGRFGFDLFRVQVQNDLGGLSGGYQCLRFDTTIAGARSWVDVTPFVQQVPLGTLRPWEPRVQLDAADGGTLSFAPPLVDPEVQQALARALVTVAVPEGVLWQQELDFTDAGTQFTTPFPSALLEDRQATLKLESRRNVSITAQPNAQLVRFDTNATLGSLAAADAAASGGVTPASRGAACPAIATPCPLTDGLMTAVPLSLDRVTLGLAAPAVVRQVVVRGASPDIWPGTLVLRDPVSKEQRTLGMPVALAAGGGLIWFLPDGGPGGYLLSFFADGGVGGFFAEQVDPPLPASSQYEVVFSQPTTSLAEISLFE